MLATLVTSPSKLPLFFRWGVLLCLTSLAVFGLEQIHVPAALLLGPMIAAIFLVVGRSSFKMPKAIFLVAQGFAGMMIASNLPLSVIGRIGDDWQIFALGVCSTVVASSILGILLSRLSLLPGTTAVWGTSSGAASAMILTCEAYGADMRLVAFMQYLRVLCCALVTTLAAMSLGGVTEMPVHHVAWMSISSWTGFLMTIGIILFCVLGAVFIKIPGGPLIITMCAGLAARSFVDFEIVLPEAALAVSYAVIGWGIGFRFTPEVLKHAAKLFPYLLASVLALVGLSLLFAVALSHWGNVDLLTAILATSPGGADSVAVIAASLDVDMSFVMAMQIARFFVVIVTAPILAKIISKRHFVKMEQKKELSA